MEKTNLIRCMFLDSNNKPRGKQYTYECNEEIEVGEYVKTSKGDRLLVVGLNVPYEEIEDFADILKSVTKYTEDEEDFELIDSRSDSK